MLYLCVSIAMYLCGWLWVPVTVAGPQLPGGHRINPDYRLTTCVNQNLCLSFCICVFVFVLESTHITNNSASIENVSKSYKNYKSTLDIKS